MLTLGLVLLGALAIAGAIVFVFVTGRRTPPPSPSKQQDDDRKSGSAPPDPASEEMGADTQALPPSRSAPPEPPGAPPVAPAQPMPAPRIDVPTREIPPAAPEPPRAVSAPVELCAFWSRLVAPDEWTPFFVYLVSGAGASDLALHDFLRRSAAPEEAHARSAALATLDRGAEITIVPELPGAQFNPRRATILWLEDWHCAEFRMRVSADAFRNAATITGNVSFFLGPLLIASTSIWIGARATDAAAAPLSEPALRPQPDDDSACVSAGAEPYRDIFVSYSHRDTPVVERLERAYVALGDSYLRDVKILRSGEEWNPALLAKIEQADVFQLCWSEAARQSRYVEQEWRAALALQRQRFVRPMYWTTPMPAPPPELSHVHFTFVEMAP